MTITVDSTGVSIDTLDEIKTSIEQEMRDEIRSDIDTTPDSVFGQQIGIVAEREYLIQQKVRDVHAARTAAGASGQALTDIALLSGTIRKTATKSTVIATVNLDAGTLLPAGSEARVPDASDSFVTLVDVENTGGSADDFEVAMEASTTGPVRANAGTLIEIVTTGVVGWNSVTNAEDATLGQNDETDAELRVRREQELQSSGSNNVDAVTSALLDVEDVLDAKVISDDFNHTVNAIIWDGPSPLADDDEIAQVLWVKSTAGIPTIGSETGNAVDVDGNTRVMNFDRATQVDIYATVYVTVDTTFPSDGEDQIKEKVVDFGDENWGIGDDVITSRLVPPVFEVQGVVDVSYIAIGTAPSPTLDNNISVTDTQIALADTARVSVVVS